MTDCQLIAGATASTYPLGPGDIGRRYGVGVIATNAGGPSEEEFSDLTEPVQRVPTTTPPPPPGRRRRHRHHRRTTLRHAAQARSRRRQARVQRPGPRGGRFTARATASAALLAKGCLTRCKRTGRADFGSKSVTTKTAGAVKVVITPTTRAARALRKSRTLPVRVTITFRSARGGTATSRVHSLTAKGTLGRRRAATKRIQVRASARRQRAPGVAVPAPPALGQLSG